MRINSDNVDTLSDSQIEAAIVVWWARHEKARTGWISESRKGAATHAANMATWLQSVLNVRRGIR